MGLILTNAVLVELDPPRVRPGGLRIEGGVIAEVGETVAARPGDAVIDARGAVVMPGLVNGHTHLYSSLATGMPPPPRAPANFHEILRFVWWRLDRALDAETIRASAAIGALDALHCGTTTLIDHHASPNCVAGSLDSVEQGLAIAGVRSVLCYEVTERNGRDGVAAGLAENERYALRCRTRRDGRFAAMIGAHAAFTLADEDLAACAEMARRCDTGVHIHVAEDACDDQLCRRRYGRPLLDRLDSTGVLDADAILAHGIHWSAADVERINRAACAVAHNPRSNMHNAVGYARIDRVERPVLLGTDGIGADMFAEARAGWLKARDARLTVSPQRILTMLGENARQAGRRLRVKLGVLEPGATADVVVTDYVPATPLTADNLVGHFLFGMGARHVRSVIIEGRVRLADRGVGGVDESEVRQEAARLARGFWERMQRLPD